MVQDLYLHIGWPLYRKFAHAFEAFKSIVNDPDTFLDRLTYQVKETGPNGQEVTKVIPVVTPEIKESLINNIRPRMTPQPLKIHASSLIECFMSRFSQLQGRGPSPKRSWMKFETSGLLTSTIVNYPQCNN
ncbi:eukaryotic translation initiation factor 2 subunit alpha homolog isoform X2 [Spinacia oleracea]|uniref:Eukaryotic translation initiation factor 2 subunit alpha homolog isoform X2 n=1 Tax=Spinacia oleracea TaxID=3562 RepID=A0ABM3R1Y7_SPIOL|nr:eukaryotic translation initiation factor 2 subunit alpha homolog isoform X2 [Spinacia oleracea]